MSFYNEYKKFSSMNIAGFLENVTRTDICNAINKKKLEIHDFFSLLSPTAESFLEDIAKKAHEITVQHFGKTMLLFTPMYISNYCVNRCTYCGFNASNNISRKKLSMEEIRKEAMTISSTGLKHILILTGESKKETPISYITEAIKITKEYFDSVAIEIYPLTREEYKKVISSGVDSLTIYQEVYNEEIYDRVHISGPKKNYKFRLDAPERACMEKIRGVNIGSLLGLDYWRREVFFTGLHAKYLQNKYPETEISISVPRLRPHAGNLKIANTINDKELVQSLLAIRLFLPRVGITLSTRESEYLRNNLIPLGVTKMSAGVSTKVGGHSSELKSDSQFEISDKRSVKEIRKVLLNKGYQPIFKDWMQI